MTRHFDVDRALEEWLAEGPSQLPDRAIDGIVRQLNEIDQRRPTWLPGRQRMNRVMLATGGLAAAIVLTLVGAGLFLGLTSGPPDVGGPPNPTASPSSTVAVDPDGDLLPGTYAAHPLPAPRDSLTLTFTVPEGWGASVGEESGVFMLLPTGDPGYAPPGGMAILFDDVTTLNGDPCDWLGTADDVSVGPAVDDLVEALLAQTAYAVSDPVDVTIGGYSGKRVDIVVPTEPFPGPNYFAPECDQGNYRLWNTILFGESGIFVQGPADRWQTNILDVGGTRLVMVTRDFPGTSPADRAEMDAIIESLVIDP